MLDGAIGAKNQVQLLGYYRLLCQCPAFPKKTLGLRLAAKQLLESVRYRALKRVLETKQEHTNACKFRLFKS